MAPEKLESAEKSIRIVIVDDHGIMREGLRMLIETQDDMAVAGEAGTFGDALAAVNAQRPDIVLLDLDLGGVNIVERLPEFLSASKGTRVLVLTGVRDEQVHRRALRLGANGLVMKDQIGKTVLKAIRKVHAGEAWICHSLEANLFAEIMKVGKGTIVDREAAKIALLTQRERTVIKVLCEGQSNKQIANRLSISEQTVKHHLSSILCKLELSDRLELVIYSYRYSLAKPPR